MNYFLFPHMFNQQEAEDYSEAMNKQIANNIREPLFCNTCGKEIDCHNSYVLVGISTGYHINETCLEKLIDWVIEEEKKRKRQSG